MTDMFHSFEAGHVQENRPDTVLGRPTRPIAETAGDPVPARFVGTPSGSRRDPIATAMRDRAEHPQTWTAAVLAHEDVLHALQVAAR
ncbi:hypothetical protein [Burkholderia sp. S-53]|uniref:hypothetical protein n=1 Tax=Burkholderia sp. S-53 TaxID=2906514 RepID=UPI0021CFC21E|nr:hypothetical protein [Burkholderia sp. S-53]UXU86064.1 hypothetical protein LXM88_01915 [Burkholderia sp. S-53]